MPSLGQEVVEFWGFRAVVVELGGGLSDEFGTATLEISGFQGLWRQNEGLGSEERVNEWNEVGRKIQ